MPTREELRRDYQRKKVVHKSALMFLYALGIAGVGFVFNNELQDGFDKVQAYASNIDFQNHTSKGPDVTQTSSSPTTTATVTAAVAADQNSARIATSVQTDVVQTPKASENTSDKIQVSAAVQNSAPSPNQKSAMPVQNSAELTPSVHGSQTLAALASLSGERLTSELSQSGQPSHEQQARNNASLGDLMPQDQTEGRQPIQEKTFLNPSVHDKTALEQRAREGILYNQTADGQQGQMPAASVTPDASERMAQSNAVSQIDDAQALKMFNQLMEAMTRTSAVMPKAGVAGRLAELQENKINHDENNLKQFESVKRTIPWLSIKYDTANRSVQPDDGNVALSDTGQVEQSSFAHMDFETVKGSVKKGASFSSIGNSFAESALEAGLDKENISFITRALAGDVELGDMKPGDTFEVVTSANNGRNAGEVVYVALSVHGKKYERYAWTDENGERNLYTPEGIRPTKEIMKFPVEFHKYVSSPFGMRKHPRLGGRRMHKGVDLALPTGTPIKAAADGIVTHAGWGSGYGNYVEIKHKNGYTTRYAHLSKFEKGLKKGVEVYAGQNIAKGGNTGFTKDGRRISTGSHLHFEVRINGTPVNPLLDHRLEGPKKLEPAKMGEFLAFVDAVHMDAADLPSRGFGLKKALANAKVPLPITEDNNLLTHASSNDVPSFVKSPDRKGLSKALSGKVRVPMISFPMKNKRGNGS